MQQSNNILMKLLHHIDKTSAKELGCDEIFELLDEYSEAAANGRSTEQFMPLVQQHLEQCKDCCEEYEALLSILKSELARLD